MVRCQFSNLARCLLANETSIIQKKTQEVVPPALPDFIELYPEEHPLHVRDAEEDYNVGNYLLSCQATLDMYPNKRIKLVSPYHGQKQYPNEVKCEWELIGDIDCVPTITCPMIDIREPEEGEECSSELLSISDGISGENRYCGSNLGSETVLVGKAGWYLYVRFESDDDESFERLYKGFSCVVRCHNAEGINSPVALQTVPVKENPRCVCGKQYDEGRSRIVSGTDAKVKEFPWQVALVSAGTRKPFCGGSLINSMYILTAAHCLVDMSPEKIEVIIRGHTIDSTLTEFADERAEFGEKGSLKDSHGNNIKNNTQADVYEVRAGVAEIIRHKFYKKFAELGSDIALLKLDSHIDFKDPEAPSPVCLPEVKRAVTTPNYLGLKGTVTGWGLLFDQAGATSSVLQKVQVPIVSLEKCKEWYRISAQLTEDMICAGYESGGKDACQGDSGGPLVIQEGKSWAQIGIVSWGDGCAKKKRPGIFTKVANFVPWIRHKSKGATWCRKSD